MPTAAENDGFQVIEFADGSLKLLDQRLLPAQERWLQIGTVDEAAAAIRDLVVRGAPAIGITAAYAAVLAATSRNGDYAAWCGDLERLERARPTAVNLSWALNRMRGCADRIGGAEPKALLAEARRIHREDIEANRAMARAGAAQIDTGSGVLTHCNTGSLATGGIGTALGVIVQGWRQDRIARIYADETRPWLQGSRLTAWELARAGIPFQVIVEGAAASLMASGTIDWVITGADRITANGDVANKVGTCMLAVLARHFGVRMMVVAPSSTVDPHLDSGTEIAIEQRDPAEIWRAADIKRVPAGFDAWNPVFDITPGNLVDCIVTERGAHFPPYGFSSSRDGESP
ncbi:MULTISPECIES: S-methyl-5-thioribose-1-phosphate isomerase [unclassified Wenzhouxiangella]|uniref:S-methyl-5-thioribose-1-phosphate isomerase n=1 Tax=unclassified Wenzhouxiangella TaxID=2613841 RepID=UPI000E32B443|nr:MULTISPECIES: S-methyl-5-thioribose-1-phosphate isomerase [unclassified Wenzhouxiangella]RFF28661.1 S-methyl-5-thioribose-1-phosphate isomerase [Wenzhouxiangella sp. 15181]RFP70282.1 S-methyl-5-thioribose-1-phosphate isomerase [Wenzhouxiangella sp. 15190]